MPEVPARAATLRKKLHPRVAKLIERGKAAREVRVEARPRISGLALRAGMED